MLKATCGLLLGTLISGVVGAVGLGLVIALIGWESELFLDAGVPGALFGGAYGALYGLLHEAFPKLASRKLVIHFVCLSGIVMVAYLWCTHIPNLPHPSEVQRITGNFYDTGKGQYMSFSVAVEDGPTIFGALSPALVEFRPYKWIALGGFQITCQDGRIVRVGFYRTNRAISAFSVDDPLWESPFRRVYYRGGTDKGAEMKLRTAYENSKRE